MLLSVFTGRIPNLFFYVKHKLLVILSIQFNNKLWLVERYRIILTGLQGGHVMSLPLAHLKTPSIINSTLASVSSQLDDILILSAADLCRDKMNK